MANKTKSDLLNEAKTSGALPEDAEADDYTVAQLEGLLGGDVPASGWVPSATEEIVAPDGHVVLSKEDADARK